MTTPGERMVRVETQVNELRENFDKMSIKIDSLDTKMNVKIDTLDTKLDDLLALRNKGAGVLWVLSGLIGTGVLGGIAELFHWFGIGIK
jgi:hypothetical protein